MKKLLHFVLILGMFLGTLFLGIGLFCTKVMQKENLSEAIQQIDMTEMIKSEMGDRYELIGNLLDTKEFKSILGTYTDGLINYVADGSGTVEVSTEQLKALFTNYSAILLQKYPELSFLPTDQLIDFLVQSIDIEKMLPSYQVIMEKMPVEILTMIQWMKKPWLVAGSLGLFLCCFIIYLMSDIKNALKSCGLTILFSGMILLGLGKGEAVIFSLPQMAIFLQVRPVFAYMLPLVLPIAYTFITVSFFIMGLGLMVHQRREISL